MDTERKTIFLVDDDIINLNVGKNALSALYKVVTIGSSEMLFQMLDRTIPDLILLDVEMPDMDGYQTIKAIKNKPEFADVPVIFLTARTDGESELKGLSLGAIDYISKPFSPPLLLKRIEVHLLVETQKRELMKQQRQLLAQQQTLVHFNNNLQKMVDAKTQSVVELQDALLRTLAELVEWRDDNTGGHIGRTQKYLEILLDAVKKRGLYREETSTWDIRLVLQSAQLHDVGKIAISDVILQKPGKLTPEEFEQIKTHTTLGEKIIAKIKESTKEQEFLEYAMTLVATHHERWDGTGYPRGLAGENIPLLGRLMAIADVYDALVSGRPYKKALPHEQAVQIIRQESGAHFDPVLTKLFTEVADEFRKITQLYATNEMNIL